MFVLANCIWPYLLNRYRYQNIDFTSARISRIIFLYEFVWELFGLKISDVKQLLNRPESSFY